MDRRVALLNIQHFSEQLLHEVDEERRAKLQVLLEEEQAKLEAILQKRTKARRRNGDEATFGG